MEDDTRRAIGLGLRALEFASNHPFVATWALGAVFGSAVTYIVLQEPSGVPKSEVIDSKVYEFTLKLEDLRDLLEDPTAEVRMELPEVSLVVKPEQRLTPKELPIFEIP